MSSTQSARAPEGYKSFAGALYGGGRLLSTPAQTLGRTMPGDGPPSGRRGIERTPGASGGQRPTERAMTHRTRRLSLFGGRLR